jgi:hypothetical protein
MGGTFESGISTQFRLLKSDFNYEGQEILPWYGPANSLIPIFYSSGPL